MKKIIAAVALALAFLAADACAQPGPPPSVWGQNGSTIFYNIGPVQIGQSLAIHGCIVGSNVFCATGNGSFTGDNLFTGNTTVSFASIGTLANIPTDNVFLVRASGTLSGINTFAKSGQGNVAPVYMSSSLPAIAWNNTGAATDSKRWGIASSSTTTLDFNIINDAQSSATEWMTVTRSGMTVGSVALTASVLALNGGVAVNGSFTATNLVGLANLAQSGANTMLGNWTGSTANVAANAMPSCPDSGGDHLNYVSGTGITCGTGLGSGITALTGDVAATGPGSAAATLATVNSNVGSFGSSTAIPNFTANGKGLITAAGSSAVIAPAGTLTGTTLASNVVTASLTTINGSIVPTASDTFALLAASQALTNKTYNGMTITANSGTLHVGNAKSVDIQNTVTMTATDGASVAFGAGGTVAYTASSVASITGTANQITASGSTGAVTLSLSSTLVAPGTLEVTGATTFDALATGSGFAANGGNGSGGVVGSFCACGAAGGGFGWGRTTNAASNKYWDTIIVGTTLVSRAVDDTASSATNYMTVTRSGITLTSINLAATAVSVTGTFAGSSTVQGTQLISTIVTGTAPLTVASTTRVSNLNAATAGNADTVTTNANLTGVITSSGNATSIASQTGTGTKFVVDTGPTVSNITETGTTTAAAANFSGLVDTAGLRATGVNLSASGVGVELIYASGAGYVQTFNRTGSTYGILNVAGSTVNIQPGGVTAATFTSTGLNATNIGVTTPGSGSFTTITASGLYTYSGTAATASNFLSVGGTTTARNYGIISNTGAQLVFGIDNSGGTGLFTGGSAYMSAIGTGNNTPFGIAANNTIVAQFTTTGPVITTIPTDAATTDASLCRATSGGAMLTGTGTLGICLGTSSRRFKTDIRDLAPGLDAIMALRPRTFHLDKAHGDPKKTQYGFIAEEANSALPLLVGRDLKGVITTFDYLGVVPVLVKATQQEQGEIVVIQKQIASLRAENARLRTAQARTDAKVDGLVSIVAKLRPANDNRLMKAASR